MKRICGQCGHEQEGGETCSQCGATLGEATPAEPSAPSVQTPSSSIISQAQEMAGKRSMALDDLPDSLFEPIVDLPEPVVRRLAEERAMPMPEPDDPTDQSAAAGEDREGVAVRPVGQPVVPRRTEIPFNEETGLMSYHPQVVQELDPSPVSVRRRRGSKNRHTMLVFGAVTLTLLLIGAVVLMQLQPKGDGSSESNGPGTSTAVDAQRWSRVEQAAADAIDQWRSIKLNPAYASFASQFSEVDQTVTRLRSALQEKDAAAAEPLVKQVVAASDRLRTERAEKIRQQELEQQRQQRLAKLKKQADGLRIQVEEARRLAAEAKADEYFPEKWESLQSAAGKALTAYQAEEYEQAVTQWDTVHKRYNDLHTQATAAGFAYRSRAELTARRTAHFTEEQCRRIAPEPWQAIEAALTAGDELIAQGQYQQAERQFGQAMMQVPAMEARIKKVLGAKFFALRTGYLTSDVLLEVASGIQLGDAHFKKLRAAYAELGLTEDLLRDLPNDPSAGYEKVALYLAVNARTVIDRQCGSSATHTFAVGFYLRLLKRVLQPPLDAEALSTASLKEATRLVSLIRRLVQQAECEARLDQTIEELGEALPVKPDDLASAERCREMLDRLMTKLNHFETAIGLVGLSDRPASGDAAP